MIICSCNVLSDDDVRGAVTSIRQHHVRPDRFMAVLAAAPNAAAALAPSSGSRTRRSRLAAVHRDRMARRLGRGRDGGLSERARFSVGRSRQHVRANHPGEKHPQAIVCRLRVIGSRQLRERVEQAAHACGSLAWQKSSNTATVLMMQSTASAPAVALEAMPNAQAVPNKGRGQGPPRPGYAQPQEEDELAIDVKAVLGASYVDTPLSDKAA
jgi:hypothetical protein